MDFSTFLAVFLALAIIGITFGIVVLVAYLAIKRRITAILVSYFNSPDGSSPSQFSQLIDIVAQVFASRAVNQIKSVVMGMNATSNKAERQAMVDKVVQGSLPLTGLAQVLPKKWANNPVIMAGIGQLLGGLKGSNNNRGEGSSEPSPFKME